MDKDLISVVVAVYNVEPFIAKCIESIRSQLQESLEIILVDDGSTDACGKIIDGQALLDTRIKVLHLKNSGLSGARNAGISTASGKYITFVDGDDWVEPDYCKMLLALSEEYGADISSCGLRSHGMSFINYNPEESVSAESDMVEVYANVEALERVRFMSCGKLFKRRLFNELRFPAGRVHEDEFITYRLIYNSNKVACTAMQLYNRNLRDGSITRSGIGWKQLDIIDALMERAEFYREKGLEKLRIKTEKSLVGTIARLKVKTENEEIKKKLGSALSEAAASFEKNRSASPEQKMEVFIYKNFTSLAVHAVEFRNRMVIKKKKN